jgi:hypothetical protein
VTVVLAFASQSRRRSMICADELEAHTQQRTDKVTLAFDRYAVAITGADFLKIAVNVVSYFQDGVRRRGASAVCSTPENVEKLCAAVARTLPRLARFTAGQVRACVQDGRLTNEQAVEQLKGGGSMVVIDRREHQLYFASLPCAVEELAEAGAAPPRFSVVRLAPERVYSFSGQADDLGPIPSEALVDHRRWAEAKVRAFALEANARYSRRVIGDLGASVEVTKSKWEFWSSLDGPDDLMSTNGF